MEDRLRFGLIGSGSQGRYLSESLRILGQAELVACADPNEEAARQAVRQCGYDRAYAQAGEMLAREGLDAVIVATTHDQLQPNALAAVRAGKHVFVEKPMALTAESGWELVEGAREAGVKLMVGYTFRFLPERVYLKRLLDQGAVGEMAHVMAGQVIGRMRGWLASAEHGGGPLLYVGTHVIYQVLHVVERRVERVHAQVTWDEDSGVEKEALMTMCFEDGVVAQVVTSQRLGGRYGWLDVLGSAGRVRAEWESPFIYVESQALEAYRHPTLIRVPEHWQLPVVVPGAQVSLNAFRYTPAWSAEFADFLGAIREDREPAVTGEDGVRVLEITDAVFQSGRTGQAVTLRQMQLPWHQV